MTIEEFLQEVPRVRQAVKARLADKHRDPEEPGSDEEMLTILEEIDAIENMVRRGDLRALAALYRTNMGRTVVDWAPRIPLGEEVAGFADDFDRLRKQLLAEHRAA